MRSVLLLFVIIAISCAPPKGWEDTQIVSGSTFAAIRAAAPALEREGLDPAKYTILVSQVGAKTLVVFSPGGIPDPDARGGAGAFGVELNTADLRIIRAHFQK